MKLASYNPQVQLNTQQANVRFSPVANAYGADTSGIQAMARGLGQLEKTIGAIAEQNMVTDVTAANTEYNKRMNEIRNNLMNTQLDGARGIGASYEEQEKQVRQEVRDKYGLKYNRAVMAYNSMADKDMSGALSMLGRHEYAEEEKQKIVTVNNAKNTLKNEAVTYYNNPEYLDNILSKSDTLISANYLNNGNEYVKAESYKARNEIVASAVDAAISKGDWTKAGDLVGMYANSLSPEQKNAYAKAITTKQKALSNLSLAQSLAKSGKSESEIREILASGKPLDVAPMEGYIRDHVGMRYELGADGQDAIDCGLFTQQALSKAGFTLNSRAADDQYYQMEQAGRLVTSPEQAGDYALVFWRVPNSRWAYTDDPNGGNDTAYKGVTHVGILMPDGKVMQAGSNGVAEIDADTYEVVGYGVTQGGQKIPIDEQLEIMKDVNTFKNIEKRERAENISNMADSYYSTIKQMGDAGYTLQQILSYGTETTGNDIDAQKAFNSAYNVYKASKSSAAGASEKLTERNRNALVIALKAGEIDDETDVINACIRSGITSETEIRKATKYVKDYWEGKGDFAFDFDKIASNIVAEQDVKGKAAQDMKEGIALYGRQWLRNWWKDNIDVNDPEKAPDVLDVKRAMEEGLKEKQYSRYVPESGSGSWFGKNFSLSPVQLAKLGGIAIEEDGYGGYWIYNEDGITKTYRTPQEIDEILGRK